MSLDSAKPLSAARRAVPFLWRLGVCLVSAAMLVGAFHPFKSTEGAWVGLVPLLVLARFTPPVASFVWGWFAGLAFWLVNLWWFLRLGDTGVAMPVAVLGWMALAAYAAVYTGIFLVIASEGFRRTTEPVEWRGETDSTGSVGSPEPGEPQSWPGRIRRMLLLLLLPAAWVGVEWLRSNLFTGFPWNPLGVSQYRFTSIIQIASWGGVYAVSALIVLVNTSITIMVMRMMDLWVCRKVTRFQVELTVALVVFAACMLSGRSVARREMSNERSGEHLVVAWVQPAVAQTKKWDPTFFDSITNNLDRLTRWAAAMRPDLIIWPETAIPVWPGSTDSDWLPFVEPYVTNGVPLLVGVLDFVPCPPGKGFAYSEGPGSVESNYLCYNSSMLVETNCAIVGRYRKQHLVPFGEYIPTESWIPFLKRFAPLGFSCEPGRESTILRLERSGVPFSPLICFEDIFAGLSRAAVRRGAGFLVNQTNDGWFDDTSLPIQHMSHAVFRCVENRVSMVRAANTGVSCFIDRTGLIQDSASLQGVGWNLGASGFGPSSIALRRPGEGLTVYTRWGDWVFAIPCAIVAVLAFVLAVRRCSRETAGAGFDKEQP